MQAPLAAKQAWEEGVGLLAPEMLKGKREENALTRCPDDLIDLSAVYFDGFLKNYESSIPLFLFLRPTAK